MDILHRGKGTRIRTDRHESSRAERFRNERRLAEIRAARPPFWLPAPCSPLPASFWLSTLDPQLSTPIGSPHHAPRSLLSLRIPQCGQQRERAELLVVHPRGSFPGGPGIRYESQSSTRKPGILSKSFRLRESNVAS